jgi:hypothetical protein
MTHVGPQRQKKNKIKYEFEAPLLTIIKILHSSIRQSSNAFAKGWGKRVVRVVQKYEHNGICRTFTLKCQTSTCID